METDRNKLTLGRREYELSNHLGNVLATVSDVKLPAARVLSFMDYYAFGGAMPGRSGGAYRYGFNGKENDKDFGNGQLIQDYGFRLYNPAIGKFLSVDPLTASYPWYTPYQFAGNKPIIAVDLDGAEEQIVITRQGSEKETIVRANYTVVGINLMINYKTISQSADVEGPYLWAAGYNEFTRNGRAPATGTLRINLVDAPITRQNPQGVKAVLTYDPYENSRPQPLSERVSEAVTKGFAALQGNGEETLVKEGGDAGETDGFAVTAGANLATGSGGSPSLGFVWNGKRGEGAFTFNVEANVVGWDASVGVGLSAVRFPIMPNSENTGPNNPNWVGDYVAGKYLFSEIGFDYLPVSLNTSRNYNGGNILKPGASGDKMQTFGIGYSWSIPKKLFEFPKAVTGRSGQGNTVILGTTN